MRNDRPLTLVSMNATVRVARPAPPKSVTMDSPAAEVMTDLRFKQPAIVDEQLSMDAAHAHMIQQGVRLLLVLNRERSLSGILTATDIAGERPLRLAEERRIRHADILVSDIMTPLDKLEAVTLSELQHARVGNVVATLALTGRQHALV
ncbi:MAG TPA: CBS domain-containing protein, partial [Usitatibacteraceae bacterium]|nr:CBS domain-containing protein [Usitatibacteraceae bacterium]